MAPVTKRDYRQGTKGRKAPSSSDQSPNDIFVREFEQWGSDKSKRVAVKPNKEVVGESDRVRAELEKLEDELAILRQGPFGPQSQLMQSLPETERGKLLKALADQGVDTNGEDDWVDLDNLDDMLKDGGNTESPLPAQGPVGVTMRIPISDQVYVKNFNKALKAVMQTEQDLQKHVTLWKWYLRCQHKVHNFSEIIAEEVWEVVWRSAIFIKVRPEHIVMLAQHMIKADAVMNDHKWLQYIESLHGSGDTATALEIWTQQKPALGRHSDLKNSFWETGIQLYATLGRPGAAEKQARDAVLRGDAEPKLLVHVIAAWAKSHNPAAPAASWAVYSALRVKYGSVMTHDTYEEISNIFIDANRTEMALAVFRDMMAEVYKSASNKNQFSKQVLEQVHDTAVSEEEINQASLSALLALPRSLQNKYFFASWIKKLIGLGRVDAAAAVVDLMYKRGVRPDAKHLNGIIGAWFRDGGAPARQKAERMAWSMIESRIELVKSRNQTQAAIDPAKQSQEPASPSRRIPAATIETFSILLLYYTRGQKTEKAEQLTHVMTGSAQMQPNAFIMNHWLYAALRASDIQGVWDKYRRLKTDIQPDLETFAALWDTAKVQYSRAHRAHAKDFPSARLLFGETMSWLAHLPPSRMRQAQEEFSSEIYEQIVRCFCLSADLPGTLCAMHGLHRSFGHFPDVNATRLICGQVARLLPPTATSAAGSRRGHRPQLDRNRALLSKVVAVIDSIEERKGAELVAQGVSPADLQSLDSKVAKQLRLAVLTEFICTAMKSSSKADDNYKNQARQVAEVMGVDINDVDLHVTD